MGAVALEKSSGDLTAPNSRFVGLPPSEAMS